MLRTFFENTWSSLVYVVVVLRFFIPISVLYFKECIASLLPKLRMV